MLQTLTQERITVGEVGKWGVRVGGDWYSLDKKSGLSPAHFVPNQTYDVTVAASTTGKKYIHQLLASYAAPATPAPAPAPAPLPPPLPAPAAQVPAPLPTLPALPPTPRQISPEVRGQVRMHAVIGALQSPAGHVFAATPAEYDAWVKRAADLVVSYTFEGN
jgi:hypothetical protein